MNHVFTIPNALTIARLIFLVPFTYIALDNPTAGAIIAAILAATDWLDGYIARNFNQESQLGRILDPISDRALLIISFIVFLATESIPLWFALIVGLREVLVGIGTLIVFFSKKVRLDISKWGKISAFGAMAATPAWVFSAESSGSAHIGWAMVAISATITAVPAGYYSLIEYYKAFNTHNREAK